jgi:hypothetical protein
LQALRDIAEISAAVMIGAELGNNIPASRVRGS